MKRTAAAAAVVISIIIACEAVCIFRLVCHRARLEREIRASKAELAAARLDLERRRGDAVIRCRTVKLRGLAFERPVPSRIMKRGKIKNFILSKMKEMFSEEEIRGYELALKLFGLIAEDADVKKIISDIYASQAGGFYDQHTGTLYRVSGMPLKGAVMAHEYTHALQDQHFDLSSLPLEDKKNDDLALAVQCLVEGDATIVTMDYILAYPDMEMVLGTISSVVSGMGIKGLKDAPAFFGALIQFPYREGTRFVEIVKARGGWNAVNRLYSDPPRSSEQIVHPDKYLEERDIPRDVEVGLTIEDVKSALPGPWKLIHEGVMGEYAILLLLRAGLPDRDARIASEGWGGDHYMVYQSGDNAVLAWSTAWDTPRDAEEFFSAGRRALPEARIEREDDTVHLVKTRGHISLNHLFSD